MQGDGEGLHWPSGFYPSFRIATEHLDYSERIGRTRVVCPFPQNLCHQERK
jgi:hypothetical protein